jgi:hypothetical protein
MQTTHYLKREKQGRLVQLFIITETVTAKGTLVTGSKIDVIPGYRKVIPYLRYTIPHEELTEIDFNEFRKLCGKHKLLKRPSAPVPGAPQPMLVKQPEQLIIPFS